MIAITGATGNLGKLAIKHLINKGINPQNIIGIVRNKNKAVELKELENLIQKKPTQLQQVV